MKALALIVAVLPGTTMAQTLNCTFTTICSPLTDCQTHPGVPFRFDVRDGAISFDADGQTVPGTALTHLNPPAWGAVFATPPNGTILLTVVGGGEAVMTQQDITRAETVQSVSYFGTCEPDA